MAPGGEQLLSFGGEGGDRRSARVVEPSQEENEETAGGGGMGAAKDLLEIMEAPWANSRAFLVDAVALAVLACVMALVAWGYMKLVGDVTESWLAASGSNDYPKSPESIKNLQGSSLWVPLCWAGGTAVGLLKAALNLDQYPSFLEDLSHQKVDPAVAAKVLVCCMASLLTGAALGPEAGLGSTGGAIGTLLARVVSRGLPPDQNEEAKTERRRLYTLAGMMAAFASILPAPWVSLLLVVELSGRKHDADGRQKITVGNRDICLLGLVGSLAWVVKYLVDPAATPPLPGSLLDLEFSNWMPLKAVALGLASIVVILIYFIIAGICKKSFQKLGALLERRLGRRMRIIATASLAGLLTGTLGLLVPLALTDGATQVMPTLKSCLTGQLSTSDLVGVALAKSAAYWIAASGGLVGGIFFPLLYIGLIAGELAAKVPGFDAFPAAGFTVPVMMASVPAAIMPVPFTLVALPLSTFNLGPKWCVPVFIAVLTSYTGLVGTGVMRRLLERAGAT